MAEGKLINSDQPEASDKAEEDQAGPSERIVEFGWADNRPITGRRAIKEKEKKKIKAGSFGEPPSLIIILCNDKFTMVSTARR